MPNCAPGQAGKYFARTTFNQSRRLPLGEVKQGFAETHRLHDLPHERVAYRGGVGIRGGGAIGDNGELRIGQSERG